MAYEVGARNRGWLWEHRAIVAAVCLLVMVTDILLVGSGRVPFLPLGVLLLAAGMAAALIIVALVLLWVSTTASDLPHEAEPVL